MDVPVVSVEQRFYGVQNSVLRDVCDDAANGSSDERMTQHPVVNVGYASGLGVKVSAGAVGTVVPVEAIGELMVTYLRNYQSVGSESPGVESAKIVIIVFLVFINRPGGIGFAIVALRIKYEVVVQHCVRAGEMA